MDSHYKHINFKASLLEHDYGENFYILADPVIQTVLTRFSSADSKLPLLNDQIKFLYQELIKQTMNLHFERVVESVDTRMKSLDHMGYIEGDLINYNCKAVVISLARAGIFPTHICFELLHYFLKSENLRQDHFYINRKTNENDEVVGVDVSGSKIGGDIDDAYVILPDPMGATGGSISYVVDYYKKHVAGKPKKIIALHLIVTPEYIQRMKKDHPDVIVIALRLDRGLSTSKALAARPGEFLSEERGLTDTQYIVPGAGGVGEILNNSFC